ncbi:MAG: hypothetical protein DYH08_16600 [Actinobacteria bacterium ATB1]|nr:hypothetical protein [Actinobacteria bacterium ATB1]
MFPQNRRSPHGSSNGCTPLTRVLADAGPRARRGLGPLQPVLREATTFVQGLTGALEGIANPRDLLVTAFTWGVEWCRDHELLNALLEKEPDLLLPQLTIDVGPALSQGARLLSGRLRRLEVDPERADELADWVVRAIWSHTLTPRVLVDLSDPAALRRYAGTVLVPESVDVRG